MTEYIPGAIQAMSTITVGYPFDTIKSHMQYTHHKSSINCMKELYNSRGIKGFYKGASVPYFTLIFKRGVQFRVYEHFKEKYKNIFGGIYISGAIAALSMSWASSPMQNTKLSMQIKQHKYINILDFFRKRYNSEGIKGFYRGYQITLLRDITFGTTYLGTYGVLKNLCGNSYYSTFFAGGFSSILTWSLWLPIDHIKTIVQVNKKESVKSVLKKTQLCYYWKSLGPATIRIFPVSGISMVTYEVCKTFLGTEKKQ